jgi:adenosylhomocysteine nucleosidase
MRLAVVAALTEELAPLADRLGASRPAPPGRWTRCDLGTREVFLAVTGDGAHKARQWARELLTAVEPDVLVGIGFAGGLSEALRLGDLLLADRIVDEASGRVFESPSSPWSEAARVDGVVRGTAVTARAIASSPTDRARLARWVTEGPAAVDLESAAWAESAKQLGVPFVILRGISDTAGETLPLDFELLRDSEGSVSRRRVLWAACRRPAIWPDLWRLRRRLQSLAQALASACVEVIAA